MRFDDIAQAPALRLDGVRLPSDANRGSAAGSSASELLVLWPIWLHKVLVTGAGGGADPFRDAVSRLRRIGIEDKTAVADILQIPQKLVERLQLSEPDLPSRGHRFVDQHRVTHAARDAFTGDLLPRFVGTPLMSWPLVAGRGKSRRVLPRAPHRPRATTVRVALAPLAEAPVPDAAEVRQAWLAFRRGLPAERRSSVDARAGTAVLAHPAELWLLPLTIVSDDVTGGWTVWDPLTGSTSMQWRTRVEDLAASNDWLHQAASRLEGRHDSVDLASQELERRGVALAADSHPRLVEVRRIATLLVRHQLGDEETEQLDTVVDRLNILLEGALLSALVTRPAADVAAKALRATTPAGLLKARLGPGVQVPAFIAQVPTSVALSCLSGQPRDSRLQVLAVCLSASVQSEHPLRALLATKPDALVTWDELIDRQVNSSASAPEAEFLWQTLTATALFITLSEDA